MIRHTGFNPELFHVEKSIKNIEKNGNDGINVTTQSASAKPEEFGKVDEIEEHVDLGRVGKVPAVNFSEIYELEKLGIIGRSQVKKL